MTGTPSSTRHDVVVVGARVAGAATALLLARTGVDVLLVDRGAYGADTLSTHALMRPGVLQLHRWGLLDAIRAAGTPPVRRTVFHYQSHSSAVSIKPRAGVDALYAPRRTVLDPILVDAARAAGAAIEFGTRVTSLLRALDGRVVGVRVRDRHGSVRDVRTALVVGADGIHSIVAREVRAPVEHLASAASSTLYRYHRGVECDGYEWYYRDGVAAGLIPTNDGLTCVFSATSPERLARTGAPAHVGHATLMRSAVPDLLARLPDGGAPARGRAFPPTFGYTRRSHGPGWALVGDAGYFNDPISAHGLTDALRDAEHLAHAAVEHLGRPDAGASLAAYQDRRDRESARLFAVTDAIATYAWDDERIHGLLLDMMSAMAQELEHLMGFGAETPHTGVRTA